MLLLALAAGTLAYAQIGNYWSAHTGTERIVTDKGVARRSFPTEFRLFDLDQASLKSDLFRVVDKNSMQFITIAPVSYTHLTLPTKA